MSTFIDFAREDVLNVINFPKDIFEVVEEYLDEKWRVVVYLDILGIDVSRICGREDIYFIFRGLTISPSVLNNGIHGRGIESILEEGSIYLSSFILYNYMLDGVNNYKLAYLNKILSESRGKTFKLLLNVIYVAEKGLDVEKIKEFRNGLFVLRKKVAMRKNLATGPYRPIFEESAGCGCVMS